MDESFLPSIPPPRRQKSESNIADLNVVAEDLASDHVEKTFAVPPAPFCEWHLPAMFEAKYVDPFSVPARYLKEQDLKREKILIEEWDSLLEE
jgi:hypothetical protein